MKRSGWMGFAGKALAMTLMAASTGCAVHTQAPIKELAYDFSDRDFYDRAYAPSPKYLEGNVDYAGVASASLGPAEPAGERSTFVDLKTE